MSSDLDPDTDRGWWAVAEGRHGRSPRFASAAPSGSSAFVVSMVAVIIWLLFVAPGPAWALCANCLGQNRTLTPTLHLIGLFLMLPFVVAYFVARTIRTACRAAAEPQDCPGTAPGTAGAALDGPVG